MAFRKFTRAEKSSVLSKKGHEEIEEELRKEGVKSMEHLNEVSRKRVSKKLDKDS